MLAVSTVLEPSSIAPLERYACAHGWQYGGGLYLSIYLSIPGTATLINTNVHANRAAYVCSPFELSLNFHPSSLWSLTSLSRCLQGGGVFGSSYGVANFEGCNIHDNTASNVCA